MKYNPDLPQASIFRFQEVLPVGTRVWLKPRPFAFNLFGEEFAANLQPTGSGLAEVPILEEAGANWSASYSRPETSGYVIGFVATASFKGGLGVACEWGKVIGGEIVCDFRHLERGMFIYDGTNFSMSVGLGWEASASATVYDGPIWGFRSGTDLKQDYAGASRSVGVSLALPYGFNTGLSLNASIGSNGIPTAFSVTRSAGKSFSAGKYVGVPVSVNWQWANYTMSSAPGAYRNFTMDANNETESTLWANRGEGVRLMEAEMQYFFQRLGIPMTDAAKNSLEDLKLWQNYR
jgi:hypothetical protein